MPRTAMLYWKPDDISDEGLKVDATFVHPSSFGSWRDAEEINAEYCYKRLCVEMLLSAMRDLVEKLNTWEDLDAWHMVWARLQDGERIEDLAQEWGMDLRAFGKIVTRYKHAWVWDDPIEAFFNIEVFLQSIDVDPLEAVLQCKEYADGERSAGYASAKLDFLNFPKIPNVGGLAEIFENADNTQES